MTKVFANDPDITTRTKLTRKLQTAAVIAALTVTGAAGAAQAAPIAGSFGVTVWYGNSSAPNSGAPEEQALPSNPLATKADELAAFTYTGPINFSEGAAGSNNILDFLNTAGGALSAFTFGTSSSLNHILSSGGFADATLMEFTFTTPAITGAITHDDGVSIYQGSVAVLAGSSAPTTPTPTAYSLAAGTYNLWYAEVNSLPAVLQTTATLVPVPEPASLALMGMSLLGVATLRRRRR